MREREAEREREWPCMFMYICIYTCANIVGVRVYMCVSCVNAYTVYM